MNCGVRKVNTRREHLVERDERQGLAAVLGGLGNMTASSAIRRGVIQGATRTSCRFLVLF
jgi:hypothetical protein